MCSILVMPQMAYVSLTTPNPLCFPCLVQHGEKDQPWPGIVVNPTVGTAADQVKSGCGFSPVQKYLWLDAESLVACHFSL